MIQTPRDVVSTTNQLSLSIYIIVQEKKNEDLIKYLQLEINEFSSLGTFVDEHTSDILGLYLSKTSVDDFIEKTQQFLF